MSLKNNLWVLCAVVAALVVACESNTNAVSQGAGMTNDIIHLRSEAFTNRGMMPALYTCDGEDISPPLRWDIVTNAASYVIIMDDPDAPMGTWTHWVFFNIPPTVEALAAGVHPVERLPYGAIQGKNSWPKTGYGGPCPPSGTHRYFFRIYALDCKLTLTSNATKDDVLAAIQSHIIAQSELIGLYSRQQ